jgi:hypothetical protein
MIIDDELKHRIERAERIVRAVGGGPSERKAQISLRDGEFHVQISSYHLSAQAFSGSLETALTEIEAKALAEATRKLEEAARVFAVACDGSPDPSAARHGAHAVIAKALALA